METTKANLAPDRKKTISIKMVIIRIAIIVMLMELFIMKVFGKLTSDMNVSLGAILDAVLLGCLSIPLIYFWVIRPFVIARDEAEADIFHMAFHDTLTHLPNRRLLYEHLEKYLLLSARHPNFGALIYCDLDGFKKVNDSYGHDAGDALLVEIAKRLKSVTRDEDTISRHGGDEFVILVQQLDSDDAEARKKVLGMAEKIQKLLCQPVPYHGNSLEVGVSIGIRLFGGEALSAEAALNDADKAMYQAKHDSEKHIVMFNKDNHF